MAITKTIADYPKLVAEWHPGNDCAPGEVSHGAHKRAKWRCSTCGHCWEATVKNRARIGSGCPACWRSVGCHKTNGRLIPKQRRQEHFIRRATEAHSGKYDYSQVKYVDAMTPVAIVCPDHGLFYQAPSDHGRARGCPSCNESKGERAVNEWLLASGLKYQRQWCPRVGNVSRCRFDFAVWLDSRMVLVEYHGQQHYKDIGFGAAFEKTKERDQRKEAWCKVQGVQLVVIPYWDAARIDAILSEHLCSMHHDQRTARGE